MSNFFSCQENEEIHKQERLTASERKKANKALAEIEGTAYMVFYKLYVFIWSMSLVWLNKNLFLRTGGKSEESS